MKTTDERLAVIEDRIDVHERRIAVLEGFLKLGAQLLEIAIAGFISQLKKHFGEDLK